MSIVNVAAYKFIRVPAPAQWQAALKERCGELALKGTIILAEEGINLFLAGERAAINEFFEYLRQDKLFDGRFNDLEIKESFSSSQPFRRMVVRIAKEIITMRHPTICPEDKRAPFIGARKLKDWLDQGHDDEGRELVLLDTRNAFEVEVGTFKGAVDFSIERFSQFPDAIAGTLEKQSDLKEKTIVSFCTGGIRCEKAVLFMQELNLPRVFQLDGGILRYFEEVGGEHWQGECFVFDERIALDPQLRTTERYKRLPDGSPVDTNKSGSLPVD